MGVLLRLVDAMVDALLEGLPVVLPRLPQDERDARDVRGDGEGAHRTPPAPGSSPGGTTSTHDRWLTT